MTKSILRFIFCLIGLLGFSIIIAEILKKWQLISKNISPVWVIMPILILFVVKEITNSPYIRNNSKLSPNIVNTSALIINIILIIISILALISIPFLWYGAIEEMAAQGGLQLNSYITKTNEVKNMSQAEWKTQQYNQGEKANWGVGGWYETFDISY